MTVVHNFGERLRYSQEKAHESFWESFYRLAFPSFAFMADLSDDMNCQRMGVDRRVYLKTGISYNVDEKKREKQYPDILLEYISVDDPYKPGWIEKDLAIDYIAYAFMETQAGWLLNFPMLRRAWTMNHSEWFDLARNNRNGFRVVPARNKTYTTWSVAVPAETLMRAMDRASFLRVSFQQNS